MLEPWRNRGLTVVSVAVFLVATGWLFPDPVVRAERQYLFVIAIGYGHLIGALVFGAPRLRRLVSDGVPPRLFAAFALTSVLTLFAGYAWATAHHPALFVPLLAISLWHIVENDLAIARASRTGLTLAPLGRGLRANAAILATTAALLFFGDALLRPADYGGTLDGTVVAPLRGALTRLLGRDLTGLSWLAFGDFFSAVTLYHLIGFLLYSADRARELRSNGLSAAPFWRRLFWVHVPAIVVCAGLLSTSDPRADLLRTLIFSPGIYLFWSVLHVVQTVCTRGIAAGARAPSLARARV